MWVSGGPTHHLGEIIVTRRSSQEHAANIQQYVGLVQKEWSLFKSVFGMLCPVLRWMPMFCHCQTLREFGTIRIFRRKLVYTNPGLLTCVFGPWAPYVCIRTPDSIHKWQSIHVSINRLFPDEFDRNCGSVVTSPSPHHTPVYDRHQGWQKYGM